MLEILTAIVSSAITLFIILDPLLSTSMFIDLTRGLSGKEVLKQAGIATSVAGVLMLVFLVFNDVIFSILNIELDSFKVAGGIILFILGLQIVLGLEIGGKAAHEARAEQARDGAELLPGTVRKSMAGVIIGTPIMCGPGTITTVMIYRDTNHVWSGNDHNGYDHRLRVWYSHNRSSNHSFSAGHLDDSGIFLTDHRCPWRNGDCDSVKDRRTVAHSNCRTYNMERGSRPYRTNCSRTLRW